MRQSFKDSSRTVSKRFRSREKSRKKFGFGTTKITESTETVSSALRTGKKSYQFKSLFMRNFIKKFKPNERKPILAYKARIADNV